MFENNIKHNVFNRSVVKYLGGGRHCASICNVSQSSIYYYSDIHRCPDSRTGDRISVVRKRLLAYADSHGIDFTEADFDDTSRIELIMKNAVCVPVIRECDVCMQPCWAPIEHIDYPWLPSKRARK